MRRIVIAALALACQGAQAAELDIPWFMANRTERQRWLHQCQNDGRIANRFPGTCRNADAAETRSNMPAPLSVDRYGYPVVPAPNPEPQQPTAPRQRTRTLRHATAHFY